MGDRLRKLDPDGAIALYRAAAKAGNADSQASLAVILATVDQDESRSWQTKLIESGTAYAINDAGDRLREADPDGAIALYRAAAKAGNADSQASLAVILATVDQDESRSWQTKLIESGTAYAINQTGDRLREADPDGAIALYRAAAKAGNGNSQASLAVILATVDQDESRSWQTKLIESGTAYAINQTGDRLREADPDGAIALYRAAAKAGNADSEASLAEMLAQREPTPGSAPGRDTPVSN